MTHCNGKPSCMLGLASPVAACACTGASQGICRGWTLRTSRHRRHDSRRRVCQRADKPCTTHLWKIKNSTLTRAYDIPCNRAAVPPLGFRRHLIIVLRLPPIPSASCGLRRRSFPLSTKPYGRPANRCR
ncbi:hypothetical protein B7H17_11275 [Pseudomonas putida]|uniref:Uncharacterized protein n=1 Tax=Pseudomonas putida TaxID=303 RepID=A0A1X0ZYX2_PSEPU|nr:hypothetical protein B7H17_11275 [Pseudomonas putida]